MYTRTCPYINSVCAHICRSRYHTYAICKPTNACTRKKLYRHLAKLEIPNLIYYNGIFNEVKHRVQQESSKHVYRCTQVCQQVFPTGAHREMGFFLILDYKDYDIVPTISQLIWSQQACLLASNEPESCMYNQIPFNLTKIEFPLSVYRLVATGIPVL